jgi:hypothetical protein
MKGALGVGDGKGTSSTMSTATLIQPTLPALPDYSQPQTVAASQVVTAIAQANASGFRAIALAVLPSGYRVSFQRIDQPKQKTLRQPSSEHALTQPAKGCAGVTSILFTAKRTGDARGVFPAPMSPKNYSVICHQL